MWIVEQCEENLLKKCQQMHRQQILRFLQLLLEKTRTIGKSIVDTNAPLKSFCIQKGIGFINNNNIKEDFLGKKKLHLGQRGNSVFVKNLFKYMNREDWINSLFNSDIESEIFDVSDIAFILKVGTSSNHQ